MKILFLNMTPFYGGGEVYLKNLVKSLKEDNGINKIYLFSPKVQRLFNEVNCEKINIVEISCKYSMFIKVAKKINKFVKEQKIDTIILNGNRATYIAPFLTKKINIIAIKHTILSINFGVKKFISSNLFKIAFSNVNKIISISQFHKKDLIENKICDKNKIEVIYNGIDTKYFNKSDKSFVDKNIINISQISRLEDGKGHKELIIAFKNIYKKNNNVRLKLVGDGSLKDELNKIIVKENLENVIEITGFRNDVKEILQETDIFILASHSEGLPLSILEAMSMGVPVISTEVGGIPEIIKNGENGFIFKPRDIVQLQKYIENLIDNKMLRNKFSINGVNTIRKKFDIEIMVKKIKDIMVQSL